MNTRPPATAPADEPAAALGEPAWPVALLFPPQGHWTEADYLALGTNHLVEFSAGVVEVPEMPTDRHQAIVAFLFSRLLAFVSGGDVGTVRFAPLPVRLWPGKFREPDVVFMQKQHASRITEPYWEGADLVMEVVSPGTRRTDCLIKVREYAEAGVPEYWLIDPEESRIAVYVLSGSSYREHGVGKPGETLSSVALTGFELAVDDVLGAR
jgi:Uma2 family endonuclease